MCEDIWEPGPPLSDEALAGATVIVNASASPYHAGKGAERERMLVQRARDSLAAVAFCNLVGGQDELVFDGHSLVDRPRGHGGGPRRPVRTRPAGGRDRRRAGRPPRACAMPAIGRRPSACVPRSTRSAPWSSRRRSGPPPPVELAPLLEPEAEVLAALTTGLRDYVDKNRFSHVVLGVSGGIDSALVACLAVDALGAERVTPW